MKLLRQADEYSGEEIQYADVMYLYPAVNKYDKYMLGHPKILTRVDGTDISAYFGLDKYDILPPDELYHPALPYRSGGKFTFPLCRSCVEQEQPKPLTQRSCQCSHTEVERMLNGTCTRQN